MADGSVIITTELDTSHFLSALAGMERALSSFVTRVAGYAAAGGENMKNSMTSAAADAAAAVADFDWKKTGRAVTAGIAEGIRESASLISEALRNTVTVSVGAPEPSGKDASGGTVYTQNIYFEGDAVSPYRAAKQIRRQSEDLLMPY